MTGLVSAFLLASGMSFGLDREARIDGERAVERARYAFVLAATRPFDEVYPRSVFEQRVAREARHERALARAFGFRVTPELLAREYERIEKDTKAPEQWQAVKASLGNDRRRIEEVICRPLLVERTLRWRFAFDESAHAEPHGKARRARARWQAGEAVEGSRALKLSRRGSPESTDGLLERARSSASGPRVLSAEPPGDIELPLPLHPDALRVLEREFAKPGDVSSVLSEKDRFAVYRLLEATADVWEVEAVFNPKVDLDTWLTTAPRAAARRSPPRPGGGPPRSGARPSP